MDKISVENILPLLFLHDGYTPKTEGDFTLYNCGGLPPEVPFTPEQEVRAQNIYQELLDYHAESSNFIFDTSHPQPPPRQKAMFKEYSRRE